MNEPSNCTTLFDTVNNNTVLNCKSTKEILNDNKINCTTKHNSHYHQNNRNNTIAAFNINNNNNYLHLVDGQLNNRLIVNNIDKRHNNNQLHNNISTCRPASQKISSSVIVAGRTTSLSSATSSLSSSVSSSVTYCTNAPTVIQTSQLDNDHVSLHNSSTNTYSELLRYRSQEFYKKLTLNNHQDVDANSDISGASTDTSLVSHYLPKGFESLNDLSQANLYTNIVGYNSGLCANSYLSRYTQQQRQQPQQEQTNQHSHHHHHHHHPHYANHLHKSYQTNISPLSRSNSSLSLSVYTNRNRSQLSNIKSQLYPRSQQYFHHPQSTTNLFAASSTVALERHPKLDSTDHHYSQYPQHSHPPPPHPPPSHQQQQQQQNQHQHATTNGGGYAHLILMSQSTGATVHNKGSTTVPSPVVVTAHTTTTSSGVSAGTRYAGEQQRFSSINSPPTTVGKVANINGAPATGATAVVDGAIGNTNTNGNVGLVSPRPYMGPLGTTIVDNYHTRVAGRTTLTRSSSSGIDAGSSFLHPVPITLSLAASTATNSSVQPLYQSPQHALQHYHHQQQQQQYNQQQTLNNVNSRSSSSLVTIQQPTEYSQQSYNPISSYGVPSSYLSTNIYNGTGNSKLSIHKPNGGSVTIGGSTISTTLTTSTTTNANTLHHRMPQRFPTSTNVPSNSKANSSIVKLIPTTVSISSISGTLSIYSSGVVSTCTTTVAAASVSGCNSAMTSTTTTSNVPVTTSFPRSLFVSSNIFETKKNKLFGSVSSIDIQVSGLLFPLSILFPVQN